MACGRCSQGYLGLSHSRFQASGLCRRALTKISPILQHDTSVGRSRIGSWRRGVMHPPPGRHSNTPKIHRSVLFSRARAGARLPAIELRRAGSARESGCGNDFFPAVCARMSDEPKIKAVIFDMDGVLTDSEPLITAAAVAMFQEKGLTVQPEDFCPFVGTGDDRYIRGVAEKYNFAVDLPRPRNGLTRFISNGCRQDWKRFPAPSDWFGSARMQD